MSLHRPTLQHFAFTFGSTRHNRIRWLEIIQHCFTSPLLLKLKLKPTAATSSDLSGRSLEGAMQTLVGNGFGTVYFFRRLINIRERHGLSQLDLIYFECLGPTKREYEDGGCNLLTADSILFPLVKYSQNLRVLRLNSMLIPQVRRHSLSFSECVISESFASHELLVGMERQARSYHLPVCPSSAVHFVNPLAGSSSFIP